MLNLYHYTLFYILYIKYCYYKLLHFIEIRIGSNDSFVISMNYLNNSFKIAITEINNPIQLFHTD